jgi:hypothetical protein
MNDPQRTTANPHVVGSNPVPTEEPSGYVTRFTGSPLEVAIANYYYAREFDVYNIQIPEGNPYYPWFAHASKYVTQMNERIVVPIGFCGDDQTAVVRRKQEAEFVDGGEKGDLWILTLKSTSPTVYEGKRNILHRENGRAVWTVERTEIFKPRGK